MKKVIYAILLLTAILIAPKMSFSQGSDQYLLELKNGVSIKCYLVSITDNTIYAMSDEGKKLTFDLSEVKSFNKILSNSGNNNENYYDYKFEGRRDWHDGESEDRDENRNEKRYERERDDFRDNVHRKNKISFTIMGGSLIQVEGREENPLFGAKGIVNYDLRHFSVGVGFSVDGLSASGEGNSKIFTPVFADLKYNFKHMLGVRPFIFADGGYSIGSESTQGLMLSGGLGLTKRISSALNLVVDAGFKYQQFRNEDIIFAIEGDPGFPVDPGFDNEFRRTRSINSLNLNVGLQF